MPSSGPSPRLLRVRAQVRGAFARVLARDPGVTITEDGFDLRIRLRDNTYVLSMWITTETMTVNVTKMSSGPEIPFGPTFFNYTCPTSKLGPLRRTALILLKKMQHAEVYEVMQA